MLEYIFFSKCNFDYKGKEMKFRDVSPKWETWYERLKKSNKGFSFDQKASLISYIDAAMTEIHGDPKENELWTRENLRDLKQSVIDGIKSKLNQ